MKKHALAVSFAVLVVFASTSLRKGFANISDSASVWNNSAQSSIQPVATATPALAIGSAPAPMPPHATMALIGSAPAPMPPHATVALIGSAPAPMPPHVA